MNQTIRSLYLLWQVDDTNYPIARAYLTKLGVQLPKNPTNERVSCAMAEELSKAGLGDITKTDLRDFRRDATVADNRVKKLEKMIMERSQ
jgi:hypothetical protein